MKFILPLLIAVFITGCTLTNINKPTNVKKQKDTPSKLQKEIVKKKSDFIFGTKENPKTEYVYTTLNNTIIGLGEQLFDTNINKKNPARVILTSFVDLDKLDKTSTLGRLISESMFNELHIRKFLVTDFRGQEAVSVNEDGEFHITRDVEKLKDNVDAVEYILVGTYVKFENQSLLINARILDSISGAILSSARVIYQPEDCSMYGLCKKTKEEYNLFDGTAQPLNEIQRMNMNARENSKFTIISDDCKDGKCEE